MTKKAALTARKGGEQHRPPVVAVLGHVDHGKTTLLDSIRRANVAALEAGGITQRIGAYQISFTPQPTTYNPQPAPKDITFIDTPGHLAFSQMRSRGAKVADLVVLVVAVDEGVRPQTLESLKHIQSASIPYLVALTKIDLPETDVERVRKELGEHGIKLEKQGGNIVSVPVSGKTGEGIEDLLEMIVILAEMAELEGSINNPFKGVVIESKLDSRRGPLVTILVQDGSLKVSDEILIESQVARVKAIFNENGKKIEVAGPSKPVEVLGFKKVPSVGSEVKRVDGEKELPVEPPVIKVSEEKSKTLEEKDEEKKLKVILKADSTGTLEAIINSLPKEVEVIHSRVGNVNESDVLLAETTKGEIVAFDVKVLNTTKKLAETERVKIATFGVIYQLLEDIDKKILKMLEPTIEEKFLGRAEVLQEFEIKKERVAGCRMIEGEIKKTNLLHLLRDGKVVGNGRIKSMRIGKRVIEKVKKGEDFGVILSPSLDFNIGDVLTSFHKVEEF